jgi:C4-type Zn-finger protein
MTHQLMDPCCFGADDNPTCPNCGNTMRLRNRSPDAAYGLRYERQTFRCAACDFRVERSVDTEGKPPELLRY